MYTLNKSQPQLLVINVQFKLVAAIKKRCIQLKPIFTIKISQQTFLDKQTQVDVALSSLNLMKHCFNV